MSVLSTRGALSLIVSRNAGDGLSRPDPLLHVAALLVERRVGLRRPCRRQRPLSLLAHPRLLVAHDDATVGEQPAAVEQLVAVVAGAVEAPRLFVLVEHRVDLNDAAQ